METAEKLFAKYGAKRITIKEICQTANVSKMTFYKYFDNKSDLIAKIRDKWIEMTFKAFDEIDKKDIPFSEKVDLMTKWKVEFTKRTNPEFLRELSDDNEIFETIKTGYLKNMRKAQINGDVREDLNLEFLWLVVSKFNEIYRDGSWKAVFDDAAEFQKQIRLLLFYGILNK